MRSPFLELRVVDSNLVEPSWIVFFRQEHVSNDMRKFRGTRKGSHQPTIAHGTLTQVVGLDFSLKQLRPLAFEGLEVLCANPVGLLFKLLGTLVVKIPQGLGSEKVVIFVGPLVTAAKALPEDRDTTALAKDGGTRDTVDHKGPPQQTERAKNGAANQIPDESGIAVVELAACRSHGGLVCVENLVEEVSCRFQKRAKLRRTEKLFVIGFELFIARESEREREREVRFETVALDILRSNLYDILTPLKHLTYKQSATS